MNEHTRRMDDTGIWKWVKLYPVGVGIVLAAVSVGGYFATIKYMGEELSEIRLRQSMIEKSTFEHASILSRVITLNETMDKRVTRLEKIQDNWGRKQQGRIE